MLTNRYFANPTCQCLYKPVSAFRNSNDDGRCSIRRENRELTYITSCSNKSSDITTFCFCEDNCRSIATICNPIGLTIGCMNSKLGHKSISREPCDSVRTSLCEPERVARSPCGKERCRLCSRNCELSNSTREGDTANG